jgi:dihydroxyacetone kinase-like protein
MQKIAARQASGMLEAVIRVIQDNAAYLSEIDGAIGDGDHGINMSKGMSLARKRLAAEQPGLAVGFKVISEVLMDDMGGSMGPLYGTFFRQLFRASRGKEYIDGEVFQNMLEWSVAAIQDLGGAQVGDKTLLDTLVPASEAFRSSFAASGDFFKALNDMKAAAEQGRDATRDLVAKLGRASRLGERSRGVLDAGATSCCLILCALADALLAADH